MLVDAQQLPDGTTIDTELCIVGAGPAGIALARELDGLRTDVCLLESGGFDEEPETQALCGGGYDGTLAKADYLMRTRIRRFGGTTWVWGGWGRPFDPIDFEERHWVPHSGWPFPAPELTPYYARAAAVLHMHPFAEQPDRWAADPKPFLTRPGSPVSARVFHHNPIRFGRVYRKQMVQSRNVRLVLHANVTELVSNEAAGASPVEAKTTPDREGEIRRAAMYLARDESVRVVGLAYSQAVPAESDTTELIRILAARPVSRPADRDPVEALLTQVSRDFENGDVVTLHGWRLSITEARIYALAASVGEAAR